MKTTLANDMDRTGALLTMFDSVPRLWKAYDVLARHLEAELGALGPGGSITHEMVDILDQMLAAKDSMISAVCILQCIPDQNIRAICGRRMLGEKWADMTIDGEPAINQITPYLLFHLREIEESFSAMCTKIPEA